MWMHEVDLWGIYMVKKLELIINFAYLCSCIGTCYHNVASPLGLERMMQTRYDDISHGIGAPIAHVAFKLHQGYAAGANLFPSRFWMSIRLLSSWLRTLPLRHTPFLGLTLTSTSCTKNFSTKLRMGSSPPRTWSSSSLNSKTLRGVGLAHQINLKDWFTLGLI